jgi:hypothetical protein
MIWKKGGEGDRFVDQVLLQAHQVVAKLQT